jgi:hypothetical protein
MRLASEPRTTARITHCLRSPLAAVGHGNYFDSRIRQHIEQPFRNVLRDLSRVQRAFEFIWSDEDFHTRTFIRHIPTVILSGAKRSRRIP